MIVDSSALVSLLLDEPDAAFFEERLSSVAPLRLSAASLVETSIVIEAKFGEAGGRELDLLLYRLGVEIVPVSVEQAELAREAFRRYGKGRHPAALNYGDYFSYALAKTTGEPLLCKGSDFIKTDLTIGS